MLQEKIEQLQKQMAAKAPAEQLIQLGEEIQKIVASDIASQAKQVGDLAVDFNLPATDGSTFNLFSILESSPVVLQFNRGTWCPYCDLQIKMLQTELDKFNQHRAKLVIIMPQLLEQVNEYKEKNNLTLDFLQDAGNRVAADYGLRFILPENLQKLYRQFGIDVPGSNGDDSFTLPIPATYAIGQDRKIAYAYVNPDWSKRAEPEEVIKALASL